MGKISNQDLGRLLPVRPYGACGPALFATPLVLALTQSSREKHDGKDPTQRRPLESCCCHPELTIIGFQ